jgi:hypothetical protein
MALKEYKPVKVKKPKRSRRVPSLVAAVAVIILIVLALTFYVRTPNSSNTVYCGAFQYVVFPALSVVGVSTVTVNETMTTAVSYTTSTSITGHIGHTYANSTTTTSSGLAAGAETICKYISDTPSSSAP